MYLYCTLSCTISSIENYYYLLTLLIFLFSLKILFTLGSLGIGVFELHMITRGGLYAVFGSGFALIFRQWSLGKCEYKKIHLTMV